MKQIWTVCRTTYIHWICNTRMLVLLLIGIFLYIHCINPMKHYAAVLGTPLNVLEPFVSIMNSGYTTPLLPVLFLYLISDFPKLNQSSTFILFRLGRVKWFCGQMLFVALAGFTYLLTIFLFTLLTTCTDAFLDNGWSLAVRQIYEPKYTDLFSQSGLSQIDLSVLNQSRPYQATAIGFLLMWSYTVVSGAILMLFALRGQKLLGIFLNVITNALGLLFLMIDTPLKWVLPSAHIMFAQHYDGQRNITFLDVKFSYLYNLILLGAMLWLTWQSTLNCSFHTIDATE